MPNIFNVAGTASLDGFMRDPTLFSAALNQWNTTKTGTLANGIVSNLGFLRLPKNASIFATVPDPSSGPTASHWELIIAVCCRSFIFPRGKTHILSLRTSSYALVEQRHPQAAS
jgi:hypothetical protein